MDKLSPIIELVRGCGLRAEISGADSLLLFGKELLGADTLKIMACPSGLLMPVSQTEICKDPLASFTLNG